jgi:hypothetical protein
MTALAVGLLAAVPAVLLHAALLRFWPARLRFLALPALVLGMLALLAAFGPATMAEAWLVGSVLALSLAVAQMLLLVGVVYDSPTLAIANAILARGAAGLDEAGVAQLPARMPFVTSRLSALVAGGTLRAEGDALVMTAQAPAALRLGALYRRLRGGQAEAG